MNVLVQVTIVDDAGRVLEQIVKSYEGSYGYEVEIMFDKLGDQIRKRVDPDHET